MVDLSALTYITLKTLVIGAPPNESVPPDRIFAAAAMPQAVRYHFERANYPGADQLMMFYAALSKDWSRVEKVSRASKHSTARSDPSTPSSPPSAPTTANARPAKTSSPSSPTPNSPAPSTKTKNSSAALDKTATPSAPPPNVSVPNSRIQPSPTTKSSSNAAPQPTIPSSTSLPDISTTVAALAMHEAHHLAILSQALKAMVPWLARMGLEQRCNCTKSGVMITDCFATWCGPCKVIAPRVVDLSHAHPSARLYKIDVEELPELAQELGVRAMPTF
ncbi:hypothetical protein JMJ35_000046 [Cladonia borealis]|uniref:Thioredoxin domain-containing protein n=1 Tax=Cladonia borealis TaxID=184061 RepID=A0AA39RAV2_9LECA|nr:hypothetical protein JMJ35_000046 [Cladonia borealis]